MPRVYTQITEVELSFTKDGTWQDVDVSAHVPAGTTGVCLLAKNTGGAARSFDARKNGSTDTYWYQDIYQSHKRTVSCGVDASRIVELCAEDSNITVYLRGYWGVDCVWNANATDKSTGSTGSWVDVDISSDTGANTAIAAFCRLQMSAGTYFGLRPDGGNWPYDYPDGSRLGQTYMVGCVSEVFEQIISHAGQDLYWLGYVKDTATGLTLHSSAVSRVTATTGSYQNVTTPMSGGFTGFYLMETSNNWGLIYALRQDGSSFDQYYAEDFAIGLPIGLDPSAYQIEQKISDANLDLFEVGYEIYVPSFDINFWRLYPQTTGGGGYTMEEGVQPAERSRSTTATVNASCPTSPTWTEVERYILPIPEDGQIAAGDYGLKIRGWATTNTVYFRMVIDIDGGATTFTGDSSSAISTSEVDVNLAAEVTSDTLIASALVVIIQAQGVGGTYEANVRPVHANVQFQAQSGAQARSTPTIEAYSPDEGAHGNPTLWRDPTPSFKSTAFAIYPEDSLVLGKWADTHFSAAHSASGEEQDGPYTASSKTTSFPALSTRRLTIDAVSSPDQLLDTYTNTYYVLEIEDSDAAALVSQAWELLNAVQKPVLTSLNGATAGGYVTTLQLEPLLTWTHGEADADAFRVRVYDIGDVLAYDSTEQASTAKQWTIPYDVDIETATTHYVVLTLVSNASGWSIDSLPGYFQIDDSATSVKFTNVEGSSDEPEIYYDTWESLITWEFTKTQHSFCLTAYEKDGEAVAGSTGWVVSATQSTDLLITGLYGNIVLGNTYALHLQVKDAQQQHVYSCDKRAWIHINETLFVNGALTAEPDTDTKTAITLAWTAAPVTDGDTVYYEVELRRVTGDTWTRFYYSGTQTSVDIGRLSAGTYQWIARGRDEHTQNWGTSFTGYDEFIVSLAGNLPLCYLASAGATLYPLISRWSFRDEDGDAQTDYQIQLASDAGFSSIVEDTGVVASANLYHQHAYSTPGTYYRRAKVRTASTDWSDWSTSDQVTISSPVAQSDDLDLFRRHSDGVLSRIWVPLSGPVLTKRLDGPSTFRFTMDNFYPLLEDDLLMAHFFDEMSGAVLHHVGGTYDLDLSAGALSGLGYHRFQATYASGDDFTFDMGTAFTAVFLAKPVDLAAADYLWSMAEDAGDVDGHRIERGSADATLAIWTGETGPASATSGDLAISESDWQVFILVHSGTALTLYRMDTATSATVTAKNPVGTPKVRVCGWAGLSGGAEPVDCYLAAYLLYSAALDADQRTLTYRALQENWKHRGYEIL